MKYRITCYLTAVITIILSPFLSARTNDVFIVNNFSVPLHVEFWYGYCVYDKAPKVVDVPPGGMAKILIDYIGGVFHHCGYQHSSENYRATAATSNGINYTFEFQWYKSVTKDPEIHFLENPNNLMSMGTTTVAKLWFAGTAEDDKPCIYFNGQHGRSCKLD